MAAGGAGIPEVSPLIAERRFHFMRHFSTADPAYVARMLPGVPFQEAEAQTRLPGSKFLPLFAVDPDAALARILARARVPGAAEVLEDGPRLEIRVLFPDADWPEGIGRDGLIALEALPAGAVTRREERAGHPVTVAVLDDPPRTRQAVLVLLRASSGSWEALTLFPGTAAPPFPDPAVHDASRLEDYGRFWTGHALVAGR